MNSTKAESRAVASAAERTSARLKPLRIAVDQAPGEGEQERAEGAHGAALGRRRQPDEDRAEHEKDQQQRRHHDERHLPRQPRQQPPSRRELDEPVGGGDHEGHRNCRGEAEDHAIGAGIGLPRMSHQLASAEAAASSASEPSPRATLFPKADRLGRQTRCRLRGKVRDDAKT